MFSVSNDSGPSIKYPARWIYCSVHHTKHILHNYSLILDVVLTRLEPSFLGSGITLGAGSHGSGIKKYDLVGIIRLDYENKYWVNE